MSDGLNEAVLAPVDGAWMRLSDWGRQFGRSTRVSWQMWKDGRLPDDLESVKLGSVVYVRSKSAVRENALRTVLYARVSSSGQAFDLERQSDRLQKYARQQEWLVDEVVMETASGLNGKRRKFLKVLSGSGPVRLVVVHRDRLTRFGFEMVEAAIVGRGGEVVVIDDSEVDDDLVRDVTEVLTSMCARLYGRRSAANRARRAMEAAAGDRDPV